jgi:GT2 family glycosyltransferase
MIKLSIITVSWKVKDKLRENLTELFKSAVDFEYEVFVVDNDSDDTTVEMVKNEFPQVKLMVNNENLGFAKANNQAIKLSQGEYILLLNPDMRTFPDTLAKMVDWMEKNEQAWVAGCHLVDEKDQTILHVRNFPTLWDQLAVVLKLPHLFPGIINEYLRTDFDYGKEAQVDSIRGGFFMIRRNAIEKIRLLDERYFIWFEEVDYCRRVKSGGGEVWYTPAAKCVDYVGASFAQIKTIKKQRMFRRSMLQYFRKWHTLPEYLILLIAWAMGIALAVMLDMLKVKNKAQT